MRKKKDKPKEQKAPRHKNRSALTDAWRVIIIILVSHFIVQTLFNEAFRAALETWGF